MGEGHHPRKAVSGGPSCPPLRGHMWDRVPVTPGSQGGGRADSGLSQPLDSRWEDSTILGFLGP